MSDIRTRCIKAFSEAMDVDPSTVTDATDPDTLDNWDSLAHVQLILAIEKEFSISIPPDESVEVDSFKAIVALIESKVGVTT